MSVQIKSFEVDRSDMDIFSVSTDFEVFDRPTALALDHLLDHLQFLWAVASLGVYTTSMHDALSRYSHYGMHDEGSSEESDRAVRVIEDECVMLVKYFSRICAVDYVSHEGDAKERKLAEQEEKTRLLKEMRDRVPFIDASKVQF